MSKRSMLIIALAALALFASGYLTAQNKAHSTRELIDQLSERPKFHAAFIHQSVVDHRDKEMTEAEKVDYIKRSNQINNENAAVLREAANNPLVASGFADDILTKYYLRTEYVEGAVQASQISGEMSLHLQAVQIAQNARIIELLQKIADKK